MSAVFKPKNVPSLNATVWFLGITQIIGYGTLYYSLAILATPVAESFGVTPSLLYGFFSLGLVAGGIASPFAGELIDRQGAGQVMTMGSLIAGLLVIGLAFAPALWAYLVIIVLIEIVSVAVLYDAAFALLGQRGGDRAQSAIMNLTLIAGFASTLFWPLTGWLVQTLDWRGTYMAFGFLHIFIALPLHAALRDKTSNTAPIADLSEKSELQRAPEAPVQPIRPTGFWLLATSFALSAIVISAVTFHMVPVLIAVGLAGASYPVAMLMGPAQVVARLVNAVLWQRFHPVRVAIIASLALPVSILLLLVLPLQAWAVGAVFAVAFGAGAGLTSIVRGTVPLALFGDRRIGARLGQLAAIRTFAAAGAPFAFGALMGGLGVHAALLVVVAFGLVGAALLVILGIKFKTSGHQPQSSSKITQLPSD